MQLIEPTVEQFLELNVSPNEQIARCARVCYGKEGNLENADNLVEGLIKNEHLSMLRHNTKYLHFKNIPWDSEDWIDGLTCNPINPSCIIPNPTDPNFFDCYIAVNGQVWLDEEIENTFLSPFADYSVDVLSPKLFINECREHGVLFNIFRLTYCLTTQISTSRELNRKSPNNIAERSTRYCSSKDGLLICKPWWWDEHDDWRGPFIRSWQSSEEEYQNLINQGVKPEDARGVLPLDTLTKVIYTYSIQEWKQILDLRYYGKTGKPHPNAKLIMGKVREDINHFIDTYQINAIHL